MVSIRLLISSKTVHRVELESSDWFVYGIQPDKVTAVIDDTTSFATVVEKITTLSGEYSLVCVDSGSKKRLRAYRGVTSSFDIFYTRRPSDGTIIVGDHFRDVLSELPQSARTVPESVAADQLLFGTRPQNTYVTEIERLGHGESLEWEYNCDPQKELVDTLSVTEQISPSEAKRRLDRYFSTTIDTAEFDGPVTTMLSGGVDSTLIQSYLNTEKTVSAAFDSPEFSFEVEYAERASDLLETRHQLIELDETDFVEAVEATTKATGHPLKHLQTTLLNAIFSKTPYQTYLNGDQADAIFGIGPVVPAHLAQYTGRLTQLLPEISSEIQVLKKVARQLELPATDPDGVGMGFSMQATENRVANILGEDIIQERKQKRLEYVRDRIDIGERAGYANHMHLGHLILFFQSNTFPLWRHAAHSNDKTLLSPFVGRKVVETALAVSPEKRYARLALPSPDNYHSIVKKKYMIKELLEQQLPAYNTKKRKGGSGLPLQRYFEEGPLSNAFEKYPVPEFIPETKHDLIRDGTDHVSWYAFSYAVWKEQILENSNISLFDGTTVIER